tara:strand:+ start:127 stop:432 length:306 start_codon:yes stop_codon:yes gene_type:complete
LDKTSQNQILAYSSVWVAVILNFIPGFGTGYIYQGRWTAYWLTILFSIIFTAIGVYRDLSIDPSDPLLTQQTSIDFWGLFAIATITSIKADFKVKFTKEKS